MRIWPWVPGLEGQVNHAWGLQSSLPPSLPPCSAPSLSTASHPVIRPKQEAWEISHHHQCPSARRDPRPVSRKVWTLSMNAIKKKTTLFIKAFLTCYLPFWRPVPLTKQTGYRRSFCVLSPLYISCIYFAYFLPQSWNSFCPSLCFISTSRKKMSFCMWFNCPVWRTCCGTRSHLGKSWHHWT